MNNAREDDVVRESTSVKDIRGRRLLKIIGLVFLISLFGGGAAAVASYLTLRSAAEDGTVLAQEIQQACERPGKTDPDLAPFCPKADEVVESAPNTVKSDPPPGPEGPEGEEGEEGPAGPAPTPDQVLTAVRQFCSDTNRCRGEDGADATPAQVAIAVASYCDNRGQCRGAAGSDGEDGADAPPVTQEQLVAAVDTYCSANNNCRGPAGQNGQNGSDSNVPGPPGVVDVQDDCAAAPEGQVIADVNSSYNAETQTVVISCTYKEDQTGVIPDAP